MRVVRSQAFSRRPCLWIAMEGTELVLHLKATAYRDPKAVGCLIKVPLMISLLKKRAKSRKNSMSMGQQFRIFTVKITSEHFSSLQSKPFLFKILCAIESE